MKKVNKVAGCVFLLIAVLPMVAWSCGDAPSCPNAMIAHTKTVYKDKDVAVLKVNGNVGSPKKFADAYNAGVKATGSQEKFERCTEVKRSVKGESTLVCTVSN